MSSVAPPLFALECTFARALPELTVPAHGAAASAPQTLIVNDELATSLGLDADRLAAPEAAAVLTGSTVIDGTTPVAQAYAGHQFGNYSPRLGDGRALLLGELLDPAGRRFDMHLKGSGRTPFARGGDGLAAVGPMLREYLVSEAMHALGIPTTRALAVVATGERVFRDTALPGAVLVRIAASHLRVGSFQYAARHEDPTLIARLADYAIARHDPTLVDRDDRYVAFFRAVLERQAALVARWMAVGFVHGVMNTDNVAISGETIDYGPCAFLDAYDPATVFSSIDHAGRYAFGNQAAIAQWNLARLAETLLPLIDADADRAVERATAVLGDFPARFRHHWDAAMRTKLGVPDGDPDEALAADLLDLMRRAGADYTSTLRGLSDVLRGDEQAWRARFDDPAALDAWIARWRGALRAGERSDEQVADALDAVNPRYIPRNHLVEEALMAGTAGNLDPFTRLLEVVRDPYGNRPDLDGYAEPAPAAFADGFRTFCGT